MKKLIKDEAKKAKKSTKKKVEPKKSNPQPSVPTKKNVPAKKAVVTSTPIGMKKTTYKLIDRNIYFTGYSYRTRVTIDGKINSRNFGSVRAAKKYRTTISKTR
jgi:hypothetical protein